MRFSNLYFIFILCFSACTESTDPAEPFSTSGAETFADNLAVDQEEKIILYNGPDVSPVAARFLLGGDQVTFEDTASALNTGEAYDVRWRLEAYTFFRTELPLLKVKTRDGRDVAHEYSSSRYRIIENNEMISSGNTGIRLRGQTSLSFPKKSYRLELWENEEGMDNRSESLLGMREDDDWLLDGMWNEPLAVRDMSAMELWLSFGRVHYAADEPAAQLGADRRYCELFIDGRYEGLYFIGERLDRKQLKLEKYSGFGTGGELYKAKGWGEAVGGFSLPLADNGSTQWGNYEVKYPTGAGEFDWNKLRNFKSFFISSPNIVLNDLVTEKLDVANIIDYWILINVLEAFDNSGNNVFIGRRNQESPYFFVSWDYDATLGIGITGEPIAASNSIMNHVVTRGLLQNTDFSRLLKIRWAELRSGALDLNRIVNIYRDNYALIVRNGVYVREAMVPRLDRPLPDPTEFASLEDVLEAQLIFLDEFIEGL